MNPQLPDRVGKQKLSHPASSNNSNVQPKDATRYQFELPESIAEEQTDSVQKSTPLDIREIHRSASNLSGSSRQRLIEPDDFSLQSPWVRPSSHISKSQENKPGRRPHKSSPAVSFSTIQRLLKKNQAQLPKHPIEDSNHKIHQHANPSLFNHPDPQPDPAPRDFSTSFTLNEIVLFPQIKHPRLAIVTKPESPMSIGGKILHGNIAVSIATDTATDQSTPLSIGYLSVDLLGVEHCGRRYQVFQNLAVDLIDRQHPPPSQFTTTPIPSIDGYWELVPPMLSLPFEFQLPEDPGPPSFRSRHGNIRYILSTTAIIRSGFEEAIVRDTCEIYVLGIHNPRTSLIDLPVPLNATETLIIPRDFPYQEIMLRASLSRDVWASGMSVFVDVHVQNRSLRTVNKVVLSLERVIMVYHHSIAQLEQGLYRQSRLPDKIYRKTMARKAITKSDTGWRGIPPLSMESRMWMLNLPTGLATVSTGRFFGVRYFVSVSLHTAFGVRTLKAKLPVTILDPNSLDIMSDTEAHLSKGLHRRSSSNGSETPPPVPGQARKADQKTPIRDGSTQKRRETWAWVSELSPRPSLMPSPLLPSHATPAKTGKTPSRLRMENRISNQPAPHIPERLRPPLEGDQSAISNRRYQIVGSQRPGDSTDAIKGTTNASHDLSTANAVGVSTLDSLRERLKLRSNGALVQADLSNTVSAGASQENHWAGDHGIPNTHHSGDTGTNIRDVLQDVGPAILRDIGNTTRFKKSPFKKRKPLPHRRVISSSKDVRSIYRPNDGSKKKNVFGNGEHDIQDPDNGWETIEHFF